FNAQLASGTLSEARFKHYITQDAHYLIGFGRALTLAAAKAPNADRIVQFAKAAEGALVVGRARHGSVFKQYGITPRAVAQTPRPRRRVTITFRICSPPPMGSPTKCCLGRCYPASGSTRRSGATSTPAPERPTRIGPGSTPMRARSFTPRCAPSSPPRTKPPP